MSFRFKPEDGFTINPQNPHSDRYISIDRANALLEAHEKKCTKVYSGSRAMWQGKPIWDSSNEPAWNDTHTAILWNITPIEREMG